MVTTQVVILYREGLNYSQIAAKLRIDRHKVPHILRSCGEPIRLPFQGTKAEWSKQYEKTPTGFLMRTYRNMKSRVTGVQKKKAHLYKGLPIIEKEAFYEWARSDKEFWRLFKQWVDSGYNRGLSPSINRIDTSKGYVLGNMEWLTHSINSSLGSASLKRKPNLKAVLTYVES